MGNPATDSPDGLVLFRRTFVESLVADSILHSDQSPHFSMGSGSGPIVAGGRSS